MINFDEGNKVACTVLKMIISTGFLNNRETLSENLKSLKLNEHDIFISFS